MSRKSTSRPAVKKEIKAAEARWQDAKGKARAAKAVAKDAKKAVKVLRKRLREIEEKEKASRVRKRKLATRARQAPKSPDAEAAKKKPAKRRIAGTPEAKRKIVKARRKPQPAQTVPQAVAVERTGGAVSDPTSAGANDVTVPALGEDVTSGSPPDV